MIKIRNNKAKAEVRNHLAATKDKIEVQPGLCRFNYRCHRNAVHDAITSGDERIAMCVYIDGDWPVIHFINVTDKGKFVDNTLGNWATRYEYYFIKYIDKKDYFEVSNIFRSYEVELRKGLSLFTRLFSDIEF